MTNAYVSYCKYHHIHDRKPPLTHYEFNRALALAWLCPQQYWRQQQQPIYANIPSSLTFTTNERLPQTSATTVSTLTSGGDSGRRTRASRTLPTATETITATTTSRVITCRVEDRAFEEGAPLNVRRLSMAYDHLPLPRVKGNVCCALHNWVADDKTRRYKQNLMYCLTCRVHLCIKCYKRFHKEPNLLSNKQSIKEEYKVDNNKLKHNK